MGKTSRAGLRNRTLTIYLIAGVLTWVLVTLMLYWGDRFTISVGNSAPTGSFIGFWAAGGYALLVSAIILVAGWLQSTFRS